MNKRFGEWLFGQIAESQGKNAGQVEDDFAVARQEMENAVDNAFTAIRKKLNTSFADPLKVDVNLRRRMAQNLMAIAARLQGGEPPSAVKEHARQAEELVREAGEGPADIRTIGDYLNTAKGEVMGQVDKILSALRRDMINKGIASLSDKVDAVKQGIEAPPLSGAEREEALSALADLGRAGLMTRQTGLKKPGSDIKIYRNPDDRRGYVTYDPNDSESIQQALQGIANPRRVWVSVQGSKPVQVDLTNAQTIARLMGDIHARSPVAPHPFTPDEDPMKMARKKGTITKPGEGLPG